MTIALIAAVTADSRSPAAAEASRSWTSIGFGPSPHWPPDPSGAVGLDHVVSVVNSRFAFYDKLGALTGAGTLADLFAGLATTTPLGPRVIYDSFRERWVIAALEAGATLPVSFSDILVAVSDDANPSGVWYETKLDSLISIGGQYRYADSLGLGVDEEAVYLTANMLGANTRVFADARIWVVEKDGLYDGAAATAHLIDPPDGTSTLFNFALQPGQMLGLHPDAAVGTYFTAYNGASADMGQTQLLHVYTLKNPLTGRTLVEEFVELGSIDDAASPILPRAPQNAAVPANIDTGDRRVTSSVWRDGELWATTTLVPPAGPDAGQATAHWFRLSTELPGITTLLDQGDIGGEDLAPGTHTFYPAVTVNGASWVGFSFAASAPSLFPGAYVTFRQPNDPAGTVGPTHTVRAGIDRYVRTDVNGDNRWGESSAASFDATDGCLWVYNEYSLTQDPTDPVDNNGRWGTAWARFCVTPFCGDGVVQADETCDPPGWNTGSPSACRFDCSYCGDGTLYPGAGELIANGDFDRGSVGWKTAASGNGVFFLDAPGTTTPMSGEPTESNATGGGRYIVSDEVGPGTHALAQTFEVPADATSATLSFEMFVDNWHAATIVDPAGLDHTVPANQHARVDLLNPNFGDFDTGAAAVVANYYLGADPIAGNPNPYTQYTIAITNDVVPGRTYDLRFADVATLYFLNLGVDNVSLTVTTPAEQCDDGNNVGGDACTSACTLCDTGVFPQAVRALGKASFGWTSPADVYHAIGDLSQVGTYATTSIGSATFATSINVPATPAPGAGLYFVLRAHCPGATWSSGGAGECPGGICDRDGSLP